MAANSHHPDDRNPWPELPDVLRAGVRGARRAPLPGESLDRALERARRLKNPRPWLVRRAPLLVSAAVAATFLLAVITRLPFAPYLADSSRDFPPNPGPAPDRAAATAPLLLSGPTVPDHTPPRGEYLSVGPAGADGGRAGWDRVPVLRRLVSSIPAADRDAVERYLRQFWRQSPGEHALVWHNNSRALDQARVLTPRGELQLQGVAVEALVEGPRARTLVDHIFHNPHDEAVDAVFEFPLPDGASPSFFALYPGNQDAPVGVAKTDASETPYSTDPPQPGVRSPAEALRKIDPACWGAPRVARVIPVPADLAARPEARPPRASHPGSSATAVNAFRGRIGTILPGGKIRILFAYEETLPVRDGKLTYEYALPTCRLYTLSVALQAAARLAEHAIVLPGDAERQDAGNRVIYRRSWRNVTASGTLSFQAPCPDASVQATTARLNNLYCMVARLRPDVPAAPAGAPFARHAVFLLDTSAGEQAARFDRCVKLLRAVLEQDPDIRYFNVLTFNSGAGWLEPKSWLPNTDEGRAQALARLDGVHLEGATDLSAALAALARPPFAIAEKTPVHCFLLSDGKLTAGERDLPALVARSRAHLPWPARWHCYHTGLGEENAELFALLTRTGGGVYRCPSDRDVPAAAAAHRRPALTVRRISVEPAGRARDLFVAGRRASVYPGGELLVAARLTKPGKAEIVLEGEVGRRPVVQRFPVEVSGDGELAARGWGELAVGSLVAVRHPQLDLMAAPYARYFSLPTRLTSFALIEGDTGRAEPPPTWTVQDLGRIADHYWSDLRYPLTPYQGRQWLQGQLERWVRPEAQRRDLRTILELLPDRELLLPDARLGDSPLPRASLPASFVSETARAPTSPAPYWEEADRRARAGQPEAAARCLCGLVEARRGDAEVARLVGYRLVAIGQAALAARLLTDLVERSPADPSAHRALAVALAECGYTARAALHYEVALAQLGDRPGFAAARDELVHLLRRVLHQGEVSPRLRSHFTIRLEELSRPEPAALRISATWDSPAANVELVVTGPAGQVQQAPEPEPGAVGAETGPRRVAFLKGESAEYVVELRLARAPSEAAAAFVTVQVVRHPGTPAERVETKRVLLRDRGERVVVARARP